MILTVTLNPLLEKKLTYNEVSFNKVNRNGFSETFPGGKGINVSRQLNLFGLENIALTFLGGTTGKIYKDLLNKSKINNVYISTDSETRAGYVIIDKTNKAVTSFFEPDPEITPQEAESLLTKADKMIQTAEIVVLSGSSPSINTDYIFPELISLCNKYDKVSFCDTYGRHLQNCIDASPSMMHNNLHEIENSLNKELKTDDDKFSFLDYLYSKGIKRAALTNGNEPGFISNFDFHFKVTSPKVEELDATGSGDAFTSGLVYGYHNNLSFEETVQYAAAMGATNAASYETCNVSPEELQKYLTQISVEPIGKKMKIVDVTPR
ncbi:MAG TPA: PfkB family carbohydrate kinase [Ignavibacteriaceae bacterium]|nr:PfkB family carbohydrate kinase [Ignavibacteriaceae bacterium]